MGPCDYVRQAKLEIVKFILVYLHNIEGMPGGSCMVNWMTLCTLAWSPVSDYLI